ncbi:MAG: hypothetical protein M3536_07320 [Actinomycetota bacterium]|nr:hypothetical protein [Actinomycetota bacterium]
MSLADSIHQLSREHLRTAPDGKAHKVPALLDELRNAVTPGRNSRGGGASGPPIPIDPDALDLLREIETEARRDFLEIVGAYWEGSLEDLLQRFAGMDLTPEWLAYLERVSLEYIDRITAMLWPVKPRRKLVGKVCPSCGWATYGEERKTCLSLGCWDSEGGQLPPGDWHIECASCEASWVGEQITWLLTALDTPSEELTHVI